MCGIAAVLGMAADGQGEALVERIVASQKSRGPNGSGLLQGAGFALGHNRLALIDLEGGVQPMSSGDGAVHVSYNGEIYNFVELKQELEACGHRFRTRSDTEVILYAWKQWGRKCVERFRGMFAFVLVDSAQRCALLARDAFGIKPLYLRRIDDGLVVASDLRAISTGLSLPLSGRPLAVELFLRYQFIPEPFTIYNEIERMAPATAMWLDLDSQRTETWRYHDFAFRESRMPEGVGSRTAVRKALQSVEAHTIADVPYGVFFSGGIDSTFVASALQRRGAKLEAFTLGVRGGNEEEVEISQDISRKLGLDQVIEWTEADSESELLDALRAYGEPFADSSSLPCWLLSRRAARSVRLVLSGDGGDEVFGGYGVYREALELERSLQATAPRPLGRRVLNRIRSALPAGFHAARPSALAADDPSELESFARALLELRLVTSEAERAGLYRASHANLPTQDDPILESVNRGWFGRNLVDFAQRLDFERYLPGSVLRKVDVCSMAFGLEVRVPLLDVDVLESARGLPRPARVPEYANGREVGKWVLRQALENSIGTENAFAWKRGFGTPRNKVSQLQACLSALPVSPDAGLFAVLDFERTRQAHVSALAAGKEQLAWSIGCLMLWANDHPEVAFA